jgi:hypothetical protein
MEKSMHEHCRDPEEQFSHITRYTANSLQSKACGLGAWLSGRADAGRMRSWD